MTTKLTRAQGAPPEAQLREARRDARKLKEHLTGLTAVVRAGVAALDRYGATEQDHERGKALARIANALEMENDRARYFGLGVDWRKDVKPEKPAGHAALAQDREDG